LAALATGRRVEVALVPVATITPDRIKAKDRDSLPDLIRLAKENGWTAIKVSGDAEFQRAAYLAASAQGIKVDGYKPDEKTKAAAERETARQGGAPDNQARSTRTANQSRDTREQAEPAPIWPNGFAGNRTSKTPKTPSCERRKATSRSLWQSRPNASPTITRNGASS
jgi:hypothetical protein